MRAKSTTMYELKNELPLPPHVPPQTPVTPQTPASPTVGSMLVYTSHKPIWRYKLIVQNLLESGAMSEEEMNKLGEEGWDLCGTLMNAPEVHYYFKRLEDNAL